MDLLIEFNKLTKEELIEVIMSQGLLLRITKKDIVSAKIEILSRQADVKSKEALVRMEKCDGTDHDKWLKASKDHNKAMKIYDKIDSLCKDIWAI